MGDWKQNLVAIGAAVGFARDGMKVPERADFSISATNSEPSSHDRRQNPAISKKRSLGSIFLFLLAQTLRWPAISPLRNVPIVFTRSGQMPMAATVATVATAGTAAGGMPIRARGTASPPAWDSSCRCARAHPAAESTTRQSLPRAMRPDLVHLQHC